MRLSNRKRAPTYNFINTIIFFILIGGIGLYFLERFKFDVLGWESILLIIIPILILIVMIFRGKQIFEYDSDGEALNFTNYHIYTFLNTDKKKDEFPKYKFLSYEIMNAFLVKKLYIKIRSKKSKAIILKYDISYLSSKEVKDLKFSLNKVSKANIANKDLYLDN